MRKLLCALMVLMVVGGTAAFADQLKKGNNELNFSFSWSSISPDVGSDTDVTILFANWGYLFTDANEGGIEVSYNKTEVGSLDSDSTSFSPFYEYNFKAGETVNPYLGAHYTFFSGDLSDIFDDGYGLRAGVKIYPWANGGFNFGFRWDTYNGSSGFPDADSTALLGGVLLKW